MPELEIEGIRKRAFRTTTDSRHLFPVAPNVLMRDFEVTAPDTAWATDVTYIQTTEGWLYLAVILDLFSRRMVGYAMSERIDRALSCSMRFAKPWSGVQGPVISSITRIAAANTRAMTTGMRWMRPESCAA